MMTALAGPAAAGGPVCVGVVVDDANGAAPNPQAARVQAGASDLDVLSAAGDTVTQNNSGLVCAINAYPPSGLQDCHNASNGLYYYWSYWQGDPYANTWTYAGIGPAEHTVADGQTYVEGWRYQDPGPDSASAPKPSVSPAAAFAAACPGVTPVPKAGGGGGGSPGGGGSSGSGAPVTTSPSAVDAPGPTGATHPPGSGPTSGGQGAASPAATANVRGAGGSTARTGDVPSTTTASTVSTGSGPRSRETPSGLALSARSAHRAPGGDPVLPIVVIGALIGVMGAAAWFRWRRRPGEE